MVLATITDVNQWQFVFPNILALEEYSKKYTYHLFGRDQYTIDLINYSLEKIKPRYGDIRVGLIPTFFEFYGLEERTTNHEWITNTTMDRFVIPYATNIKKYIWLDTDTLIVSKDIFKVFKEETSYKGIAGSACDTTLYEHVINFSNADFLLDIAKRNSSTFNAGVLLIDCEKLQLNYFKEFIEEVYSRSNGNYVNDEVILNLYDQTYKPLTPRFNCMTHKAFLPIDPIVVHFSGKDYKPWVNHIYTGPYMRYYKLWEYYYGSAFR